MRKVFGIGAIIGGIGLATYIIIALVANFAIFKNEDAGPKVPEVEEARYAITVEANNNTYFTASYEQMGSAYILHGFWERSGNGFRFRDRDLILDSSIYGKITVVKRQLPKPTTKGG